MQMSKSALRSACCLILQILISAAFALDDGSSALFEELTDQQVAAYPQCRPQDFDRWFLVSAGADLRQVVSNINQLLISDTSGSGEILQTARCEKSLLSNRPGPRVQLILEPSSTPYTASNYIRLDNLSLGLCTRPPPWLTANEPIPPEHHAVFQLADSQFENKAINGIRVNKRHELNINSVMIDGSDWTRESALFHLICGGRLVINNATIVRLGSKGEGTPQPDLPRSHRAIVHAEGSLDTCSINITRSRLFQGAILGHMAYLSYSDLTITDSELILSRNSRVSFCYDSDIDIIGTSIYSCSSPISLNAFSNLEETVVNRQVFCTNESLSRRNRVSEGFDNRINIQQVSLHGHFLPAFQLNRNTLKTGAGQNTGNQLIDFSGQLCTGLPHGTGTIDFGGGVTCPAGQIHITTQLPVTNSTASPNTDETSSITLPPTTNSTTPTTVEITSQTELSENPPKPNSSMTSIPNLFMLLFAGALAAYLGL